MWPGLSAVRDLRDGFWRLLGPTPQSIRFVAIRGGPPVLGSIAAGAQHVWRDTVPAPEDSILLVHATANVEHGTDPLADEPDTNIELAASVDGARIGRALETLHRGEARVLVCSAPILVKAGNHQLRVTLKPFDAGVTLGDVTVAAFVVPETLGWITVSQ